MKLKTPFAGETARVGHDRRKWTTRSGRMMGRFGSGSAEMGMSVSGVYDLTLA